MTFSSTDDLRALGRKDAEQLRLKDIPTKLLARELAARTLRRHSNTWRPRTLTISCWEGRYDANDHVGHGGSTIQSSADPRFAFAALLERLVHAWSPGAALEIRVVGGQQ